MKYVTPKFRPSTLCRIPYFEFMRLPGEGSKYYFLLIKKMSDISGEPFCKMYAPAYLRYFTNRKKVSYIASVARKTVRYVLMNLVIAASLTFGIEFADISGDISEVQFDTLRFFRVIGDIEIPEGKTVYMPGGTVLLFESEKAMFIRGGCHFDGTPDRKIIVSFLQGMGKAL